MLSPILYVKTYGEPLGVTDNASTLIHMTMLMFDCKISLRELK